VATRKTSAKVILNRQGLNALGLDLAGGMSAFVASIIERAHVPDAPPLTEGLVETGGWGVWLNGRKVAGRAQKPRRVDLGTGIVGLAGWGSPIAHFLEFGTINMAAEPFAMPALLEASHEVTALFAAGVRAGLHP
jgi:hypothetical protein